MRNINEFNRIKTINVEERTAEVVAGSGTYKEILDKVMTDEIIPIVSPSDAIVGISYEANRFVGRHDNGLTRALRAPGLLMQRFTTAEPDAGMLEVAILALQSVIPENEKEDRW